MCGIAGAAFPLSETIFENFANDLLSVQRHRGPDQEGAWKDSEQNIVFVHNRLSIIDVSDAGKQPMASASNRYTISYNGEIYNFLELRERVSDYAFKGRSDTEVILACIERFGIHDAIPMFIGMFAFAIYDKIDNKIYLVRDRIGEKPLYYWQESGKLVFASEQRAIERALPHPLTVDLKSLSQYFCVGYISAPRTVYEDVYKVVPGHIIEFGIETDGVVKKLSDRPYWSLSDYAIGAYVEDGPGDQEQVARDIEAGLRDSVRRQLIADVPVGCFLSGGIDSSLVATLAQQETEGRLKTFTIGYEDPRFDERTHAAGIAQTLNTEHFERSVTESELVDTVDILPSIVDDVLANPSVIPNYLLAKFASEHVKVALSGDGGDELYVGYNRYLWFERAMRLRRLTGGVLGGPLSWLSKSGLAAPVVALAAKLFSNPHVKLQKLAAMQNCSDAAAAYRYLISYFNEDIPLVEDVGDTDWFELRNDLSPVQAAQYFDQSQYLPGDNLLKLDRSCMAVSLEGRLPLLDHRLVESSWGYPSDAMMSGGDGKWPLRSILERVLPNRSYDRPKMGFSVPIDQWLQGPLLPLVDEAISASAAAAPYLDIARLKKQKACMLQGELASAQRLWVFLVFYLKVVRR